MQTIRLRRSEPPPINFAFMAKAARTINPMPLKQWLGMQGRGARAKLAKKLELEHQAVLTNWLDRGIPLYRFPDVCTAIGMTEDRYRAQAGLTVKGRVQSDLDAKLHPSSSTT